MRILKDHLVITLQQRGDHDLTQLKVTCPGCSFVRPLIVPTEGLRLWVQRALIQDALPGLTAHEREMLQTGYCDICWDALWAYLEPDVEVRYGRTR